MTEQQGQARLEKFLEVIGEELPKVQGEQSFRVFDNFMRDIFPDIYAKYGEVIPQDYEGLQQLLAQLDRLVLGQNMAQA